MGNVALSLLNAAGNIWVHSSSGLRSMYACVYCLPGLCYAEFGVLPLYHTSVDVLVAATAMLLSACAILGHVRSGLFSQRQRVMSFPGRASLVITCKSRVGRGVGCTNKLSTINAATSTALQADCCADIAQCICKQAAT